MTRDVDALDAQLTRLVRRLRNPRIRRLLSDGVAEPLDRAQHVVLGRVDVLQPVRPSDLADDLDVDLSTISRQVGRLLDDGLLERTRDPADRRASRLTTTPAGRERLAEMRRARRRAWVRVTDDWPAGQLDELVAGLARFVDDLDAAADADHG